MTRTTTSKATRELLARATSETAFQWEIIGIVKQLGGLYFHPTNMRRSAEGWPDLALWVPQHPDQLVIAELKRAAGARWMTNQRAWRAALEQVRHLSYRAWTPRDRDDVLHTLLQCEQGRNVR